MRQGGTPLSLMDLRVDNLRGGGSLEKREGEEEGIWKVFILSLVCVPF